MLFRSIIQIFNKIESGKKLSKEDAKGVLRVPRYCHAYSRRRVLLFSQRAYAMDDSATGGSRARAHRDGSPNEYAVVLLLDTDFTPHNWGTEPEL